VCTAPYSPTFCCVALAATLPIRPWCDIHNCDPLATSIETGAAGLNCRTTSSVNRFPESKSPHLVTGYHHSRHCDQFDESDPRQHNGSLSTW